MCRGRLEVLAAHVSTGDDADHREAGGEVLLGALAPGAALEFPLGEQLLCQGAEPNGAATRGDGVAHLEDLGVALDADRELKLQAAQLGPEVGGSAVASVSQDDASWHAGGDRAAHHLEGELGLRLELDLLGNAGFLPSRLVFRPGHRQGELEVDGEMLRICVDGEADAHLAGGDFSGRAGVLALDADGVLALLEEARVVDNPPRHLLPRSHRVEGVSRRKATDRMVVPLGHADEVEQPLVLGVAQVTARFTGFGKTVTTECLKLS